MTAPPPPPARIAAIDGLRGLAVMGILLMNIADFALPPGAYFNPRAAGGTAPADLALWAISFVLVDGKMRALFSILFGASTAIVVERAQAAGLDAARIHFARMITLALFGAAHLFLLWQGDILLHYALIGIVALPFTALEPRQQIRIALMLLAVQILVSLTFMASFLTLHAQATAPGATADTIADWQAFAAGLGVGTPQDIAQQIAIYRGPWSGIVAHVAATQASSPLMLIPYQGAETLAYMLIGMAALRSGFLTGAWCRTRTLRWAAIGYAVALPPTIALCWLCIHSGFDTLTTYGAALLGGIPFRPMLALADAALAITWLGSGESRLRQRITAAGRAAFSNYLGTSLMMTFLFYGWGLGLYGRLERVWLLPVVLAAWAIMLLWSTPWLARFRYGPMEWAWRSLARGKIQPMRRVAPKSY